MLCRVVAVNYEVYMPDKRKRKAVYHINMLKKWHTIHQRLHVSGWLMMLTLMGKMMYPLRVVRVVNFPL